MRSSTRRTILWATALVVALAVVGVAFVRGEAGDTAEPAPPSPSPRVPGDPGPGCGDAATTDVADVSVGRTLARCAPGAPAAEPRRREATVTVALTDRDETAAPLVVAEAAGEFAAEGLAVEIVHRDRAAAYEELAAGEVDAVVGRIDGRFFDAVHDGVDAQLVLGGQVARDPSDLDQAQAGLWLRADLMGDDGQDWRNVEGTTVLVPGGLRSAAVYPMATLLGQHGLGVNLIDVRPAGAAQAADELRAALVGGAWLTEPHATEVAEDDALVLVATVPGSEALDATVFGSRLLGDDRAVGEAYVRAVIRTINTHLADGYSDDALDAVAAALDVDEKVVAAGPAPLFDWEIRKGTTDRLQVALIEAGGVRYDRPTPERDLVDRSFVSTVVGSA